MCVEVHNIPKSGPVVILISVAQFHALLLPCIAFSRSWPRRPAHKEPTEKHLQLQIRIRASRRRSPYKLTAKGITMEKSSFDLMLEYLGQTPLAKCETDDTRCHVALSERSRFCCPLAGMSCIRSTCSSSSDLAMDTAHAA